MPRTSQTTAANSRTTAHLFHKTYPPRSPQQWSTSQQSHENRHTPPPPSVFLPKQITHSVPLPPPLPRSTANPTCPSEGTGDAGEGRSVLACPIACLLVDHRIGSLYADVRSPLVDTPRDPIKPPPARGASMEVGRQDVLVDELLVPGPWRTAVGAPFDGAPSRPNAKPNATAMRREATQNNDRERDDCFHRRFCSGV